MREQPQRGMGLPPILSQLLQQSLRQHDLTVLAPFSLFNAQQVAFTINMAHLQCDRFADAQPAGELYSEAALPLIHIHMETVILIEVRV